MTPLYHYTSTEAFHAIISNFSVRLSSLTLSNDSREGELIVDVLLDAAREARIDPEASIELERVLRWSYEIFDGVGLCLSQHGDLLSQWRGYADDGHGICIGFNKEYFEALKASYREKDLLDFDIVKVRYSPDEHMRIGRLYFDHIREPLDAYMKRPANNFRTATGLPTNEVDFLERRLKLAAGFPVSRMFEIKGAAFQEEHEWRVVSILGKGDKAEPGVGFQPRRGVLAPYLELPLGAASIPAIASVTLGPKNRTPHHVIRQFLTSRGALDVEIKNSVATYR